jgi:hypothetical protein
LRLAQYLFDVPPARDPGWPLGGARSSE